MKSHDWLTGMHQFTLQLHCYAAKHDDSLNGTIVITGSDQPLAFSGLAQLWRALETLRRQPEMHCTGTVNALRQLDLDVTLHAANEPQPESCLTQS
jgi:hypothetical protein